MAKERNFSESVKFFKQELTQDKKSALDKRISKTQGKYKDATDWVNKTIGEYIQDWKHIIDQKMEGIMHKNADSRFEKIANSRLSDQWKHAFKMPLTKIMANRVFENYYETQIPINIEVKGKCEGDKKIKQELIDEISEHMNAYEYISTKTKDNGRVITDMGDGYGLVWCTMKTKKETTDAQTGKMTDVISDIKPHIKTLTPGTVLFPIDCKFDEISHVFVRFHETIRDCLDRYRGIVDDKEIDEIIESGLAIHLMNHTDCFSTEIFENYNSIKCYKNVEGLIGTAKNDDKIAPYTTNRSKFYQHRFNGHKDKGETVMYFDKNFQKYIVYFNKYPLFEIEQEHFGRSNGGRRWHNVIKTSSDADPNVPVSEGIPEKITSLQQIIDSFFRKYMDNMSLNANPPLVTDGVSTLENAASKAEKGKRRTLTIYPGAILQKTGGSGEIEKFPIGDVTGSSFKVVEYIFSLASILCYLSRYTGAGGKGVERSAQGAGLMGGITERGISIAQNNSQYFARNAVMLLFNDIIVKSEGKQIKITDDIYDIDKLTTDQNNFELSVMFSTETIRSFETSRKLTNVAQYINAFGRFVQPNQHEDGKWLFKVRKLSDSVLDAMNEGGAKMSPEDRETIEKGLDQAIDQSGIPQNQDGDLVLEDGQAQDLEALIQQVQEEASVEGVETALQA